jgi:hypothetical protein
VADGEGTEEMFRIASEFSDDMSDEEFDQDLILSETLFLISILGNNIQKEDIDKFISSYESAVHLTPHGHSNMSHRLDLLGIALFLRFDLAEDLTDISDAISYQQKAVHLTPEGHADMPSRLNNLGNSFQCRFKNTRDLADIPMPYHISRKQSISFLRAMQTCPVS